MPFCCFLDYWLILFNPFLIPALIAQIFNPSAELATPIGTPANEAKVEI